jgi:uncharacterized protein (TIGR03083 family)
MTELSIHDIKTVLAALKRGHRELVEFAETLPAESYERMSYCSKWTVAQVYSHLGSGAEIGLLNLQAGLTGNALTDPWTIWNRWDALPPEQMIGNFAAADSRFLDALDQLDLRTTAGLMVPMNAHMRFPLGVVLVMRLAEHALHSWDIHVTYHPDAEVPAYAADLLMDLYPWDFISTVAAQQIAGPIGTATLRIDIERPPRSLLMTFADTITLETIHTNNHETPTGHLAFPTAGPWTRLLTGRLDPQHTPAGTHSEGTPTLETLRTALQGDPMAAP